MNDLQVQISNTTKADRYPKVFRTVVEVTTASGMTAPRILSYGCSTGEEASTLATKYFPQSEVFGVDVSADALAEAKANYGDNPRIRFEMSTEETLSKAGLFDVIFAMSVLCRWPQSRKVDNVASMFPFEVFEKQAVLLDGLVKPGGILIIYNANYSFLQSDASRGYDLIAHPRIDTCGFVKRFDKSGEFLDGAVATDCIYQKAKEATDPRKLIIRNTGLRQLGIIPRDID
jgi:hypothetical protein